jgi:hypothetical protein
MSPLARRRTAAVAALAALLLIAPTAAAVRSSASGPSLTGDPAGRELARRVNRSYANVPAVRVEAAVQGALVVRFTLVMRNGVTVAEQALVDEGSEPPTLFVRRESEGTFVRDPDRSCWRFVPASDPQALTDVGAPMLPGPGRVSRPRVTGDTIVLPLTSQGRTARFVIDRKTSRLRRMDAGGYTARFTTLAKRPTLPVPKPLC